ncbi:CIC_collapsed_G0048020.mRNA.1.CDS.1 [Saccharomyces cerevisiae]|nr:CIC_collapsed_G0048020.mRNA.1.CDS.1 [Saccharomyces cerevisiae]
MQKYLDRTTERGFKAKMGKNTVHSNLRRTKNIDYDSLEFKFDPTRMIAGQYLLLDEQSEPRRYYNPSK